jgi:hypothetical protein
MRGLALWIADTPGRPQLLVSDGLPGLDDFVRMFSGGGGALGAAPDCRGRRRPLATRRWAWARPPRGAAGAADERFPCSAVRRRAAPQRATGRAELLPDDDILACSRSAATRLGRSIARASHPEHDVLGLFAPGSRARRATLRQTGTTTSWPVQRRDRSRRARPQVAPAKDDRWDCSRLPATPPFRRGTGRAGQPGSGTPEPDILDMFGIPPAKPEGKEAK